MPPSRRNKSVTPGGGGGKASSSSSSSKSRASSTSPPVAPKIPEPKTRREYALKVEGEWLLDESEIYTVDNKKLMEFFENTRDALIRPLELPIQLDPYKRTVYYVPPERTKEVEERLTEWAAEVWTPEPGVPLEEQNGVEEYCQWLPHMLRTFRVTCNQKLTLMVRDASLANMTQPSLVKVLDLICADYEMADHVFLPWVEQGLLGRELVMDCTKQLLGMLRPAIIEPGDEKQYDGCTLPPKGVQPVAFLGGSRHPLNSGPMTYLDLTYGSPFWIMCQLIKCQTVWEGRDRDILRLALYSSNEQVMSDLILCLHLAPDLRNFLSERHARLTSRLRAMNSNNNNVVNSSSISNYSTLQQQHHGEVDEEDDDDDEEDATHLMAEEEDEDHYELSKVAIRVLTVLGFMTGPNSTEAPTSETTDPVDEDADMDATSQHPHPLETTTAATAAATTPASVAVSVNHMQLEQQQPTTTLTKSSSRPDFGGTGVGILLRKVLTTRVHTNGMLQEPVLQYDPSKVTNKPVSILWQFQKQSPGLDDMILEIYTSMRNTQFKTT